MGIDVDSLFTFIWLQIMDALVTGLVIVAVIAVAFRLFKVRGIAIERESENRDQERDS